MKASRCLRLSILVATTLVWAATSALGQEPAITKAAVGLVPLDEMSAKDRYQGEEGGLYGDGANVPPESQRKAAEAAIKEIRPRDANGKPSDNGRVVLISLSMSNATQE